MKGARMRSAVRISLAMFLWASTALAQTGTVLYAGAAADVYKSTDGGETWQATRMFGDEYPYEVFNQRNFGVVIGPIALAVDPRNPATVYASTTVVGAGVEGGVYKTLDGGQSWQPMNNGLPRIQYGVGTLPVVQNLVIDPTQTSTLYALARGVYKSTDGGTTWRTTGFTGGILFGGVDLVIDPLNPSTLYVLSNAHNIYRTSDGGDTWTDLGAVSVPGLIWLLDLAIDETNPSRLYAAGWFLGSGGIVGGIVRSTDSGTSWKLAGPNRYLNAITVDPFSPSTLYAAGSNSPLAGYVAKSTDGGDTWMPINTGLTSTSIVRVLVDSSDAATLYAGAEGPDLFFKSSDGGATWKASNSGLGESVNPVVSALALEPVAPSLQLPDGAVVNGAAFVVGPLAPDSWVSLFGQNLGKELINATEVPLPTSLGGTQVTVTDALGIERLARLLFVAPGQLNFLMPPDTAPGEATVTATNAEGQSASTVVQVAPVAPGIFSANASGVGAAAATFLMVEADGSRLEGLTFDSNAPAGSRTNIPIDLGPSGRQVYLSFFGTGFRFQSSASVEIGSLDVPILGAVAQGQFAGLDQAVVGPLPQTLSSRGEVEAVFTFDGIQANAVTVDIR